MTDDSSRVNDLHNRAAGGDQDALRALFARHHDRLKRMVHLHRSRRLVARVDDSDVLQEAYIEVARRLDEYFREPSLSFFPWIRHMTGLKLAEIHRRHLGTQLREALGEVTLHRGGLPLVDSISLAALLLGTLERFTIGLRLLGRRCPPYQPDALARAMGRKTLANASG